MTTRHRRVSGIPNVPGRVGGEDWDDDHLVSPAHISSQPFAPAGMGFGVLVDVDPFVADGGSFVFVIDGISTDPIAFDDPISSVISVIEAHPSIGAWNVRSPDFAGTNLRDYGYLDFNLAGDLLSADIDIDIISTVTPSLQAYTYPASVGSPPRPTFGDYAIDETNGNIWRFDGHDSSEARAPWAWQPVPGQFVAGTTGFGDFSSAGGRLMSARSQLDGDEGDVLFSPALVRMTIGTFADGLIASVNLGPTRVDLNSATLVEMAVKEPDGSHTYTRATTSRTSITLRANHDTNSSIHGDLDVSAAGIVLTAFGSKRASFQATPAGLLGQATDTGSAIRAEFQLTDAMARLSYRDASGAERGLLQVVETGISATASDASGVQRGVVDVTVDHVNLHHWDAAARLRSRIEQGDTATEIIQVDANPNLRSLLRLDDAGNALLDSRDGSGNEVASVSLSNSEASMRFVDWPGGNVRGLMYVAAGVAEVRVEDNTGHVRADFVQLDSGSMYGLVRDGAGTITAQVVLDGTGILIPVGLPSSDPHVVGQLWNSAGTMKISAG